MRRLIILTALAAASAMAADLSGVWEAAVELDAGNGTATFDLKQSGDALTGTYAGALGEAKVAGKLDGKQVEWSFEVSPEGGDKIQVKYAGTLADDGTISGSVDYGSLGKGTFKAKKKTAVSRAAPAPRAA